MSIPGAMLYGLNELSGFMLYTPTTEEVNNYSEWVKDNRKAHHQFVKYDSEMKRYGFGSKDAKEKIPEEIRSVLTAGYVEVNNIKEEDYSLMGLSFLPWNKPLKHPHNNKWVIKRVGGVEFPRNPLNGENLMTILKIALFIASLYLGGKVAYRLIRK